MGEVNRQINSERERDRQIGPEKEEKRVAAPRLCRFGEYLDVDDCVELLR